MALSENHSGLLTSGMHCYTSSYLLFLPWSGPFTATAHLALLISLKCDRSLNSFPFSVPSVTPWPTNENPPPYGKQGPWGAGSVWPCLSPPHLAAFPHITPLEAYPEPPCDHDCVLSKSSLFHSVLQMGWVPFAIFAINIIVLSPSLCLFITLLFLSLWVCCSIGLWPS